MNRKSVNACRLLGLLLIAATTAAVARSEPVELQADRAEMSQLTGTGVYTGNVVLTQGPITITGDRMTVYTTEARELERVIVEGEPARFEQLREAAQPIRGRSPRMEYHATAPEHVLLLEGAMLWQGKNEFSGETINYDLTEERVIAEGEGERRTRITFFPRADDAQSDNQ